MLTTKSMLLVTAVCALLINVSRIDRHVAFVAVPIVTATICVTIALSSGFKHRLILSAIGAIASVFGVYLANSAFPYVPNTNEVVYLTTFQYNQLYMAHLRQFVFFSILATLTGITAGFAIPQMLTPKNSSPPSENPSKS